jgi:hypothetical protein
VSTQKPTQFLDGTPIKRGDIKAVMFAVMPQAYAEASEVTGEALAREMMYAARRLGQDEHGLPADAVESKYFTQRLLREYLAVDPEETTTWKVAWDERGSIREPHTHREVRLGTREVRTYVSLVTKSGWELDLRLPEEFAIDFDTVGPRHRYQGVLLVEKAGRLDALEATGIPERFDVAFGTTRGQSTTGARELIDWLTEMFPAVPILVAHDFDGPGLSIVSILSGRHTRAHRWKKSPNVIDLGLRLTDVKGLLSEAVNPPTVEELVRSKATPKEIAYLRSGRRVELNALVGYAWPDWIEAKLEKHLNDRKVVPPDDVLADAYKNAHTVIRLNRKIERLVGDMDGVVEAPDDLVTLVTNHLAEHPRDAWDDAIRQIAAERAGSEEA